MPCELGGGQYGYLGITITKNKYQAATGHTFTPYTKLIVITKYL